LVDSNCRHADTFGAHSAPSFLALPHFFELSTHARLVYALFLVCLMVVSLGRRQMVHHWRRRSDWHETTSLPPWLVDSSLLHPFISFNLKQSLLTQKAASGSLVGGIQLEAWSCDKSPGRAEGSTKKMTHFVLMIFYLQLQNKS
jgi:hypothetical protein